MWRFFIGILIFFAAGWSPARAEFADADTTHPFFHAIDFLEKTEVVRGHERNGKRFFYPRSPITRAEAVKIIVLAAKIPDAEAGPDFFQDVRRGEWFFEFVEAAAGAGIVRGFADGNFHPAARVSRAEFLKMALLAYFAEIPSPAKNEEWFAPVMRIAKKLNLAPYFSPQESLHRGEAAEILYRIRRVAKNNFKKKYVFSGEGKASFYNEGFAGKATANGEIYDPNAMTAAHRTLKFGTRLKVWHGDKFVVVRINDRGPYHKNRVLDLSQRAFESLAPISRGVLDVEFEVFSGPNSTSKIRVPEFVRPHLGTEVKNAPIARSVEEKIKQIRDNREAEELSISAATPLERARAHQKLNAKKSPRTPLFGESIAHLSTDFWENIRLRRTIPQKIPVGTIMNFSGTTTFFGAKKVTVFLQKIESPLPPQTHFFGTVSGNVFSVPVAFLQSGKFRIGIVFDDERESKVAEIEVAKLEREPRFPSSDARFSSDLEARVLPENRSVLFSFATGKNRLAKIVFSQGEKRRTLRIEDGLGVARVPYDFFENFTPGEKLAVDLWQAGSERGTLESQNTNWRKVAFQNFVVDAGFPDFENKSKIVVRGFRRFFREPKKVRIHGEFLDEGDRGRAFLTLPSGKVREIKLRQNEKSFSVEFSAKSNGTHIFEIVSSEGEILFNRAIYFSEDFLLPVLDWQQTKIRLGSRNQFRYWINKIRREHGSRRLVSDVELDRFAQNYAEKMASERFISHTSPTGVSFASRVKKAGFTGRISENLSFGTDLKIALAGLENSGSHRKNMLEKRWRRVGIGFVQNEDREWFLVHVFGD